MTDAPESCNTHEPLPLGEGVDLDLTLTEDVLLRLKAGPLFTIYLPDGRAIRLHWDGPKGLTGTGLRFENNCAWLLGGLLVGEVG